MSRTRDKQDPVIQYKAEHLVAFVLAIGDYARKNPNIVGDVDLSQDAVNVIEKIIDYIGYHDTDSYIRSSAKPGYIDEITFVFNDIVEVLALESFLAFLRRLGFDIGDFDGEEWDTPGYDSYSD